MRLDIEQGRPWHNCGERCTCIMSLSSWSIAGMCLVFKVKPPVFLGHTVILVNTVGGVVQGLPLQVETHLEQSEQSLELAR